MLDKVLSANNVKIHPELGKDIVTKPMLGNGHPGTRPRTPTKQWRW